MSLWSGDLLNKLDLSDEEIELMLKMIYIFQAPLPLFENIKQKIASCLGIELFVINNLCQKVKLFVDSETSH